MSSGCLATNSRSKGPSAVSSAFWSGGMTVKTPSASLRPPRPKPLSVGLAESWAWARPQIQREAISQGKTNSFEGETRFGCTLETFETCTLSPIRESLTSCLVIGTDKQWRRSIVSRWVKTSRKPVQNWRNRQLGTPGYLENPRRLGNLFVPDVRGCEARKTAGTENRGTGGDPDRQSGAHAFNRLKGRTLTHLRARLAKTWRQRPLAR